MTLKFRLADAEADPKQFIDALFHAGCDDATIGIGQRGRIALEFTREADTALAATASALEGVKRAIDHLLIEVSDATMKVNIAWKTRHLSGAELPKELQWLLV